MITVVTSSLTSKGGLELQRAATQVGAAIRLCLVSDPETPAIIDQAEALILRIGPLSYPHYQSLVERVHTAAHKQLIHQTLAAFDKCQSYDLLHDAGIPMPHSQVIDHDMTPPFLPGVLKVAVGNQGKGVALVKTQDEFHQQLADFLLQGQCLWQEYIAESVGSDKRIVVVGNRIITAMRRIAKAGDFRANLHTGATAEAYVPTDEEALLAIKATAALGLPYSGVDIIDSDRGPLVLEVNPSPGFQISTITGVDVARELIVHNERNTHD